MNTNTFMITSRSVLHRMRNAADKVVEELTHVMFGTFFSSENRTFYEIMCENIVEPVKPQTTIWRMRIGYIWYFFFFSKIVPFMR